MSDDNRKNVTGSRCSQSLVANISMNKEGNRLIQPEIENYYSGCGDSERNAPIPEP